MSPSYNIRNDFDECNTECVQRVFGAQFMRAVATAAHTHQSFFTDFLDWGAQAQGFYRASSGGGHTCIGLSLPPALQQPLKCFYSLNSSVFSFFVLFSCVRFFFSLCDCVFLFLPHNSLPVCVSFVCLYVLFLRICLL